MNRSIEITCGQLIVAGFSGASLPQRTAKALARGFRGGVVLFRRNVPDDLFALGELTGALRASTPPDLPPLIAIDQEGGRVARLTAPAMTLPPMRALGASPRVDAALARRVARAQAEELAALGITMSFAPVLDVDSNAANPIIGDRAFAATPERVIELGLAWAGGLGDGSVLACGKHFPGHGDTFLDSHLALPVLNHTRERLAAVELAPFRAAARAGLPALMTAHVVATAYDTAPATLSHAVSTDLLRGELGFNGLLLSDDLEMGALRGVAAPDEAAVLAVEAGCDVVLMCSDEDLAEAAHGALIRRAERDARFRNRCEDACARGVSLRRTTPPRPQSREGIASILGGPNARDVLRALAEALR